MKDFKYIIIGGGMTGASAVKGIRKNDPDGSIAMFSDEQFRPYNRPPLTKGLWDDKEIDDIIRPMDDYDVNLFLETAVKQILPDKKTIATSRGEEFRYQKLLIATGGDPIHLPESPEGVIFYRTRADYQTLKEMTKTKDHFCVIGGGFIGSEIAAALTKNEKKVTMIFPEVGISGLRFSDELAEFLNDYYREKGVVVHDGFLVDSIVKDNDGYQVKFNHVNNGETKEERFDGIIAGLGIKPNIQLAEEAGLDVDDGIVVNEFLQTTSPDIFAAGDVAYFINIPLGRRVRVEHEDNANQMGMAAGLNMVGPMKKYDHFPFFYSDLFDLGYEAVGELNKDFTISTDWIEPFKKGTIFYLKDKKIRGLIFWNLWGQVDKGCEVIAQGETYDESELKGLFSE